MVNSKELLINHLEELQKQQGMTHVNIDPEAREILMQWYKAGKKQGTKGANRTNQTTQTHSSQPSPTHRAAQLDTSAKDELDELNKPLFETTNPNKLQSNTPQHSNPQPTKATTQSITQPAAQPTNYKFAIQAAQPNLTWVDSNYQTAARILILTETPQTPTHSEKLQQILGAMKLDTQLISTAALYKQPQAKINDSYTELSLGLLNQELAQHPHNLILGIGANLSHTLEPINQNQQSAQANSRIIHTPIDLETLISSGKDLVVRRQFWETMLQVMQQLNLPITEKQQNLFK